jgi:RHS repeat-associated protein
MRNLKFTVTYAYDPINGKLQTRTQPEGVTTFGYESSYGLLNRVTGPTNVDLSFTRAGPLVLSTSFANVPVAGVTPVANWTYTPTFKLASASMDQGTAIDYTYDADDVLSQVGGMQITRGANGQFATTKLSSIATSYGYDGFGDLSGMTATYGGSTMLSTTLTKDSVGRIIGRTESVNGVSNAASYQYDHLDRISSVTIGGVTTSYSYDVNGNRLNNGAVYDAQDRLISDSIYNYAYDGRGALRQKVSKLNGEVSNYQYDVFGHLMSATLPGGKSVNYQLDGLGRRVARQVNGGAWTGLIYQDDTHLIGMVDASGIVTAQFVYGTSDHSPDYMSKNGVSYRIISDERGSVRLVVNATDGTVAQRMDYDVWGNVTADTAPGFQPFGFAGGFYDNVTGLVRFGARDYDASTGRWMSKDPILFNGGQANLYVYAGDDPVNKIDPDGRNPIVVAVIAVAAVGGISSYVGTLIGGGTQRQALASVPTGAVAGAAATITALAAAASAIPTATGVALGIGLDIALQVAFATTSFPQGLGPSDLQKGVRAIKQGTTCPLH